MLKSAVGVRRDKAMVGFVLLLLIVALLLLFFYLTVWRDWWIRNKPFPEHWKAMLAVKLPVYQKLADEEKVRLQQLILLFFSKKKFVACAGMVLTDEIKLTIAAEACLLLLKQGWSVYPKLNYILVYPTAFRTEREQRQADGTVTSISNNLLGESWSNGRVILSWDDVAAGVSDFTDGHNVVLHEFAHQLDSESGAVNGAPYLRHNSYQTWARVLSDSFEDLKWRSMHHQKTVMDEYGTTNPAEFFAGATETFFEKPWQLYKNRPQLYEELSRYYQLDPRKWCD